MARSAADARWLGRFDEPAPIRRVGLFFLYRALQDGAPRVVAVSRPELDPVQAREMVDEAVAVHQAVDHPAVPAVVEHGEVGDLHYVAFACDALCDLEFVLESLGDPLPPRLPVIAAGDLLQMCADVLTALDAAPDVPAAGRLTAAQILISMSGAVSFIGLGCDFMAHQGPAVPRRFEAPEYPALRTRGTAGPAVDVYLLGALAQALVAVEEARPAMTKVRLGTGDADLEHRARWRALTSPTPAERPDLAEARRTIELLWPDRGPAPWPALMSAIEPLCAAEAPGAVVGRRYRLQRRLGFGRRGAWFLAWDQHLEQPVAIKWLDDGGTEVERARLLREVNLLRSLRHPNVMAGYDVLLAEDRIGAVVEYVPGDPLAEVIGRDDIPPAARAASLAGIADALAYLGRRGVVHRDVKPSNIILHQEREAVLVDLGLARPTDGRSVTHPHELLGTFRYMAPEQLTGPDVGPSADVYAFSMVLIDVLVADRVVNHPGPREARQQLDTAGVPEVLARLISEGVSPDPARRPAAARLAEALRALEPPSGAGALIMAMDGRWFNFDGSTADLRRRGSLRRILAALGEAHLGQMALDVLALQEAGWPDEQMRPESGRNRVYTAISTLRREGLRGILERFDDGYRLTPTLVVRRVDGNSMPPGAVGPPPRV